MNGYATHKAGVHGVHVERGGWLLLSFAPKDPPPLSRRAKITPSPKDTLRLYLIYVTLGTDLETRIQVQVICWRVYPKILL